MTTGTYSIEIGATTQGGKTIATGLSEESAFALAKSIMDFAGGNWKTPYATSNGKHFFKMAKRASKITDNMKYVFVGSLPVFGTQGTH